MIDWERRMPPEETGRLVKIAQPAVPPSPREVESTPGHVENSSRPDTQQKLEMLSAALAVGQGYPDLCDEILRGAREGLERASNGETTLTMRQAVGLEAVILTDGSRPSLTVADGFVDVDAPDVGNWSFALRHFENAIRRVIAAVGRVNIPANPKYAGTAFAIAPGLVITNRHVLEAIARQDAGGKWTFKWPAETTIDFVAEDGAAPGPSFAVRSVELAGPDAINNQLDFARLDMAVLRLDTTGAAAFPHTVRLEGDPSAIAEGRQLYAVGFPARPGTFFGPGIPPPRMETLEVINTVFRGKFGVKKLAPGYVERAPGDLAGDHRKWIFSHDSSTLGGNSGSALVDLDAEGARVIGLHFAGISREENYGHSFAALAEVLKELDVDYAG